jgi:hydrogenase maturation protease
VTRANMLDSLCSETVVIGVGNTILSDDGVGVHAARLLMRDSRVPPGIGILDGGTLGLELLAYVVDASRILLLDAVHSGAPPGTLTRLTGKEMLDRKIAWSVHQVGVTDLLVALTLMSSRNPEIVLLGVEPASTDWGTSLSVAVEAALAPFVEAALHQLCAWHSAEANPKFQPAACREGDF